jgi:hypothetical protein
MRISTILTLCLVHSGAPTKNDILVPETVLKKRKSQEKEREQRAADLKKKRDVSTQSIITNQLCDENNQASG